METSTAACIRDCSSAFSRRSWSIRAWGSSDSSGMVVAQSAGPLGPLGLATRFALLFFDDAIDADLFSDHLALGARDGGEEAALIAAEAGVAQGGFAFAVDGPAEFLGEEYRHHDLLEKRELVRI